MTDDEYTEALERLQVLAAETAELAEVVMAEQQRRELEARESGSVTPIRPE